MSDSGTIYPLNTHSGCSPHETFWVYYWMWGAVFDQSCMEAHPDGLDCVRWVSFKLRLPEISQSQIDGE